MNGLRSSPSEPGQADDGFIRFAEALGTLIGADLYRRLNGEADGRTSHVEDERDFSKKSDPSSLDGR